MPRSHWNIIVDSTTEKSATKVVNECLKLLSRPPLDYEIEKYIKGGYRVMFQLYHYDELSWPEIVYEVLCMSEKLGSGWVLSGSIESDPSGILNQSNHTRIKVAGVQWVEWQIYEKIA